jgi:hypothetical protein
MLMEYHFKVVYRAGLLNMDADGLSHNLDPYQEDTTSARCVCQHGFYFLE